MAFADDLKQAHRDRVTLVPEDIHGRIDLARVLAGVTPATAVYVCGPEGLLCAVEAMAAELDIVGEIHLERFTPKTQTDAPVLDNFEVEFVRTGITVSVGPDSQFSTQRGRPAYPHRSLARRARAEPAKRTSCRAG